MRDLPYTNRNTTFVKANITQASGTNTHQSTQRSLTIVVLGLSLTSSWGNGHATTFRALLRALHTRGHHVTFLERDMPWYANHRDFTQASYCDVILYPDLATLEADYASYVRNADVVIVGSYVPDGVAVGQWVLKTAQGLTMFYDIDTPVTLAKLKRGDAEYISEELISRYDCYLTFTGGPTLTILEDRYGAHQVRPLYCSVDPELYHPEPLTAKWDLGYMGTYSGDRQPSVETFLIRPAQQLKTKTFVVAGPNYPSHLVWPTNVARIDHLPPHEHHHFYNQQRFTLNITRADMRAAGYAPSVRLFEAAACGTPIISDRWPGVEKFFVPDKEILIAETTDDVYHYLQSFPATARLEIAQRARQKVMKHHTAAQRAQELEGYIHELHKG